MKNNRAVPTEFDQYAGDYDLALAQGLSVSGEGKTYFARGRILWLANCLRQLGEEPKFVLDFGCGTGADTPYLLDLIGAETALGLDISPKSLDKAQRVYGSARVQFLPLDQYRPSGRVDVVYCNGVFHHIPVDARASAVTYIYRLLRPGGVFALWENNLWNPGTRYVMSRIPFDRDAITLTAPKTRRMLRTAGFEVLRTDYFFIFPRILSWFRSIEPLLSGVPFGAQYEVLCRKPYR